MSSLSVMSGVLLCALTMAMGACAVNGPPETTDNQTTDVDGSAEAQEAAPGLSLDRAGPAAHFIRNHGACHVSILCHNPAVNVPTFCTNGAPCQGNGAIFAQSDCLTFCPSGTRCVLNHDLRQLIQCIN